MKKIFQELLKDLKEFDESAEGYGYDFRLDLSEIIHKHLAENGWTQKRLAEEAGMKSPLLTRIMHSASNCTFSTAGKILFALGIKAKIVQVETVGSGTRRSETTTKGVRHGKGSQTIYESPTTVSYKGERHSISQSVRGYSPPRASEATIPGYAA